MPLDEAARVKRDDELISACTSSSVFVQLVLG
jgi:hypothetical protein